MTLVNVMLRGVTSNTDNEHLGSCCHQAFHPVFRNYFNVCRQTWPLSDMTPTETLHRFTQLFISPRAFFARSDFGSRSIELAFVLYVVGIAAVINRIDAKMTRSEFAPATATNQALSWIAESWSHYWLALAIIGVLGMVILWYVGGFWYALRLRWAGASDVTATVARRLYVYQEFVAAFPVVLVAVAQTIMFSAYGEAWQADEYWSLTPYAFALLSCWTSYAAATTSFSLRPLPALFWFAILPLLIYLVALGVLASMAFWLDASPDEATSVEQVEPREQASLPAAPEALSSNDVSASDQGFVRPNAPPLEQFALNEYRLNRITAKGQHARTAQVTDPGGRSHRIRVGTHIGRNFGKVIAIEVDHVTVKELYLREDMKWEERVSTLRVEE